METHGVYFLENMKKLFELTQKFDGLYFYEQPDPTYAAELKGDVWEALGRKREDANLMSVRAWFEREYGQKDKNGDV